LKGREKDAKDHKDKNSWLANWDDDFTVDSVNSRCVTWIENGCIGSKEQMKFISEVLEYVTILGRALIGHNGKKKVQALY